ncbi:MAG: nucleoside hydrolase [Clostridia bacterium]|nr:nucleoside hydrolase [Clostridia bacterium]
MNTQQYLHNLTVPAAPVDVVLDTDAYNEVDDQFAISYLLRSPEKIRLAAICAAPFQNRRAADPKIGMEKSFDEIVKLLDLAGCPEVQEKLYKGSTHWLVDEQTPVDSPAARKMAELSKNYSPENPLYIVALGAITNVASALLMEPAMKENCVVVWLGGHAVHYPMGASEFNMRQDIASARVVLGCGVPVVLLPCKGVVDHFSTSRYELEHWLMDKNPLADYLVRQAVAEAESYAAGKPWTRVIWDVTAVAWLVNDNERFMKARLIDAPVPEYDQRYAADGNDHLVQYVWQINRDALFEDLFNKLTK